jgi:hypothetical protein
MHNYGVIDPATPEMIAKNFFNKQKILLSFFSY